ncbi:8839_t:CDS:2, partial [Racocetra persica]
NSLHFFSPPKKRILSTLVARPSRFFCLSILKLTAVILFPELVIVNISSLIILFSWQDSSSLSVLSLFWSSKIIDLDEYSIRYCEVKYISKELR